MTELDCGAVRELIPDLVRGGLSPGQGTAVREHVASCAECRAELALARGLFSTRAEVPVALADRVIEAVHADRPGSTRPWWGVSAAAIAALALGIGIVSQPSSVDTVEVPGYAYEVDEGVLWSSEDGLLAGAPLLDDLTDEALEQLLDELTLGSSGGAA